MKTGFKVCDAMTKKPVSVTPDTNLGECSRIMADNHVGTLIIQSGKKVEGIVTEQDIVRKMVAKGINPLKAKVADAMETKLITIEPHRDIYEALIRMRDLNIRHLPVIEKESIICLLTLQDILDERWPLDDFRSLDVYLERRKDLWRDMEEPFIRDMYQRYQDRWQDGPKAGTDTSEALSRVCDDLVEALRSHLG